MSSSFLEYMKFKNREKHRIEEQQKLNDEMKKNQAYEDFSHIKSVDMTKEYEKVHKDNRTYHNNMYLVPPHRYKNKK